MSAAAETKSEASASHRARATPSGRSTARQIAYLTLGAIALYVCIRQLPTGTNLSHVDFNVSGGNSIEFCDPKNPQFIPVVAVRSPVTMALRTPNGAALAGERVQVVANLSTSTGKTIGPQDLFVTHTEQLHLLIFDPYLDDYQHVHPTPGKKPGEWLFSFSPRRAGTYRIFADFSPIATGRGLYASADLSVNGAAGGPAEATPPEPKLGLTEIEKEGLVYQLTASQLPLKARQVTDFHFAVHRADGGPVRLEPVMDAYAHLVAVDRDRSGFAHLHPAQLVTNAAGPSDLSKLDFKVLIPKSGRYVIWAQIRVDGRERYVPFWFDVE